MELKQRDMLREIYRSNLILHGCKTYNLYITWLVPRDSKVKQILSSDWLPEREKGLSCPLEILCLTLFPVPWSQRFFLKFFFAKERASSEAATTSREAVKSKRKTFFSLSPRRFAVRSCENEEKFQEKPLGPGYVPTFFTY